VQSCLLQGPASQAPVNLGAVASLAPRLRVKSVHPKHPGKANSLRTISRHQVAQASLRPDIICGKTRCRIIVLRCSRRSSVVSSTAAPRVNPRGKRGLSTRARRVRDSGDCIAPADACRPCSAVMSGSFTDPKPSAPVASNSQVVFPGHRRIFAAGIRCALGRLVQACQFSRKCGCCRLRRYLALEPRPAWEVTSTSFDRPEV